MAVTDGWHVRARVSGPGLAAGVVLPMRAVSGVAAPTLVTFQVEQDELIASDGGQNDYGGSSVAANRRDVRPVIGHFRGCHDGAPPDSRSRGILCSKGTDAS